MKKIVYLSLFFLAFAQGHAGQIPCSFAADAATKRLDFLKVLTAEDRAKYSGLLDYYAAVAKDPRIVDKGWDVVGAYGDVAGVLNESMKAAINQEAYTGAHALRWSEVCPPISWGYEFIAQNPLVVSKMVSDYLGAVYVASSVDHAPIDWKVLLQIVNTVPRMEKISKADVYVLYALSASVPGKDVDAYSTVMRRLWTKDPTAFAYVAFPLIADCAKAKAVNCDAFKGVRVAGMPIVADKDSAARFFSKFVFCGSWSNEVIVDGVPDLEKYVAGHVMDIKPGSKQAVP